MKYGNENSFILRTPQNLSLNASQVLHYLQMNIFKSSTNKSKFTEAKASITHSIDTNLQTMKGNKVGSLVRTLCNHYFMCLDKKPPRKRYKTRNMLSVHIYSHFGHIWKPEQGGVQIQLIQGIFLLRFNLDLAFTIILHRSSRMSETWYLNFSIRYIEERDRKNNVTGKGSILW